MTREVNVNYLQNLHERIQYLEYRCQELENELANSQRSCRKNREIVDELEQKCWEFYNLIPVDIRPPPLPEW